MLQILQRVFITLDATVRARVDSYLKNEVETIFAELELTISQTITLFLKKVKTERGIPFELKLPNATTLQSIKEEKNLEGETSSLEDLKRCKHFFVQKHFLESARSTA